MKETRNHKAKAKTKTKTKTIYNIMDECLNASFAVVGILARNLSSKLGFAQRRKVREGSKALFVPARLRYGIVERNESDPARNQFRQADA